MVEVLYFLFFIVIRKLTEIKHSGRIQPVREVIMAWSEENSTHRITESIAAFMRDSSIHGMTQIVSDEQNVIGKLLWALIVIASLLTCGSFIQNYVKNSDIMPVSFEIDEKLWSLEEVKHSTYIEGSF